MSINATRSEGNTDKMNGYLEGYANGQQRGMEIMKIKACQEFSTILADICIEFADSEDYINKMEAIFRKRLEE
jgi:hypothetical protein